MNKTKIEPRTEQQWIQIFDIWSKEMDILYPKKNERNDATMWTGNPADWMEEYDYEIFHTWCEYDGGCIGWDRYIKNNKKYLI